MIAFPELLKRIAQVWATRREELREQNLQVQEALQAMSRPQASETGLPTSAGESLVVELAARFDGEHGGFGTAPKFPQAPQLLALAELKGDEQAEQMLADSLSVMARHGLFDHLAGGFFRYCVDTAWEIPHFEKMLSDNALLLMLYAGAARRWQRRDFLDVCRLTVNWLVNEMGLEGGGFAASLDADSDDGEGAYYLWRPDQLGDILDESEQAVFSARFGLDGPANFEQRDWHLIIARSMSELVEPGRDRDKCRVLLESARQKLLERRRRRNPPDRDDKLIGHWNGLAIQAMAQAGRTLEHPEWIETAAQSLDATAVRLFGREPPHSVWRQGKSAHSATLDDHAAILGACLELLKWRFQARWFNLARRIARRIEKHFVDPLTGAMYLTSSDHEPLITRPLAHADDATPSGAGLALLGIIELAHLCADAEKLETVGRCLNAAAGDLASSLQAHATLIRALQAWQESKGMVLIGGPTEQTAIWMHKISSDVQAPVFCIPSGFECEDLPSHLDTLAKADQTTAIVCRATHCAPPIHDLPTLMKEITP